MRPLRQLLSSAARTVRDAREQRAARAPIDLGKDATGGSPLVIWRLHSFYVDPNTNLATAFYGYRIDSIAVPNPDPMPSADELRILWPFKWPPTLLPMHDMQYVLPGVPFQNEDGSSDVLATWLANDNIPEEPPFYGPGGWYIVTPHFVGVCV